MNLCNSFFLAASVLLATGATQAALAVDYQAGGLKISQPWSRATPAGATVAVGFVSVTNTGKMADRLVGATAQGVKTVSIHETVTTPNGMMRMQAVQGGLEIKPGQTVALVPGGMHMMLEALQGPLRAGDKVSGTLNFAKAGLVPVTFKVERLGATAPTAVQIPATPPMRDGGAPMLDHSMHMMHGK